MKVPVSWLRSYCDPGWSLGQLAGRLTMSGTEVERISRVGVPSEDGFVVGRVLSAEPHPNADRLRVCEVETGDGEGSRTIVCGAPNVAAGQTVAVALPGAVLPGGQKLGRAKLRGIESNGMILSETELEIGADSEGIMVLADGPAPGSALADVLPIGDDVLELEVTPNRVDCLGVHGVAREVHALSGAPLADAPWEPDATPAGEDSIADHASVRVEVPELCPRFTARAFENVTIGPSPLWLKARLSAAGQRPISNVVDITNYVMLLTGQPLHAFDLDLVPGGELIIRAAAEGERMRTLDAVERTIDSGAVLVCDRERPSGIAGIMGGEVSEVSDQTTRVLLEVATWNGTNILQTSSKLGLRSEASARFEKQLHPHLTTRAQAIASALLVELCGARLVPGQITVDAGEARIDEIGPLPPEWPERLSVELRAARVPGLLGMEITGSDQAAYLERLGFGVETFDGLLRASVPPERAGDVTREADLIEEVARIHGIDEHLPATMPAVGARIGGLSAAQRLVRRAEDLLRDLGFSEVVTWAFVDPALPARLRLPEDDPRSSGAVIHNPLSEVGSVMRTTLLGGLLESARHNLARGADSIAVFESGSVYLREAVREGDGVLDGGFVGTLPPPLREPHRVGSLVHGALAPSSWRGADQPADFFTLKGVLEVLCGAVGADLAFEPAVEPFLSPGRAARVAIGGREAGWVGELHPLVAREWDLEAAVAFEIDLGALHAAASAGDESFEDVTSFPAVHEDVAVLVAEDVPAEGVRAAVIEGGGPLLRSASVFDVYRGEQIGEGRKSLALRLEFRADDRTLTAEEVATRREAIADSIAKIGGSLRA